MQNVKFRLVAISLLSIFMGTSCKNDCDKSIYFQISAIEKMEELVVILDDGKFKYTKLFEDGFIMSERKRWVINKGYCSGLEIVKVHVSIGNQCDTTIYINKSLVAGCFIGSKIKGCPSLLFDSIPPGKPFSFGER